MTIRFFYRAQVNAPVEVAWSVFTEHEKFAEWTNTDWKIIKDGSPERNGLGCIRQAQVDEDTSWKAEELINYWVPYQLYGFHIISGVPYDSHQGIVRFFPKGPNKSEWTCDAQFCPSEKLLTSAPDVQQHLLKFFTYFMQDAEGECERRASDVQVPAFPIPVENAERTLT